MTPEKSEWLKKSDDDGLYAIACALIVLAEALEDLGFHRGKDKPGCFEKIAMEMERIADKLHGYDEIKR